ncbi:MAG: DUF3822 family protein [Prolixibacteraceae bacterium]|nr:DUF3822 family protein [Prolixibacteraceae bacterium]
MQPSLFFVDETFDINNCNNYNISIQCSLDGFSFSVFDPLLNKFIVLADYYLICASPFQLKNEVADIITNQEVITPGYKKANITFVTHKTLIIPDALNQDTEETIFNFTFDKDRNDEVIKNTLINGKSIFTAIPSLLKDYFSSFFNNVSFYCPCYPLADQLNTKATLHATLYLQLHNHVLFILGTSGHELKALNSYYIKNEDDILFYTLRFAKSLGFDNNTELNLSGSFDKNSLTQKELRKYFKSISFARFSHRYSVSYTFMKKPEHIYLPLMKLVLCE